MKKNILIGCGVIVLFSLIWIGARNLYATAETDASSDNAAVTEAKDAGLEKKKSDAPKSSASTSEKGMADSEVATDAEQAGNSAEEAVNSVEMEQAEEETENIAETGNTAEAVSSSEGAALYTIKTSAGNNLGMVPVVGGNAVVLMDGSYTSIYQGDYTPEEQNAFDLKVEEETALAVSEGKIAAWSFYREAMLHDFTFPEGVAEIEKFAFARSGLNSVSIPESVTRIGYGAFYHCDTLSDVMIPESVTVIEENAFSHTPWLENWMAGGTEETAEETGITETSDTDDFLIVGDGILLAYRGSETDPELPAEVKSIVPGALGE